MGSMKLYFITLCRYLIIFVAAVTYGQESKKFQFAVPPLEIYDQVVELRLDDLPSFTQDERSFLKRRWEEAINPEEPRLSDDPNVLDAMIYASGTGTEKQRAEIRSKYLNLVSEIKAKLDNDPPKKLAETLLKTLHETAMKGGYDENCTSLSEIFSEGKFNCVSSTSLYYLIGTELGLILQPISIPGNEYQVGHATLDLIVDKQRIQIEPTNADGFEWDVKLAQPGVISLNFGPPRDSGYDVDGWDLAAMIYSNLGNKMKTKDQPTNSSVIRNYVAALCLSPSSETPNRNLAAAFINWGPELSRIQRYDEAIRVMAVAHRVAPDNRDIRNNQRIVWIEKIQFLISKERDQQAVETIAAASRSFPEERDFMSASRWFEMTAEEAFRKGTIDDALPIIERAAKKVLGDQKNKLLEYRTSLVRRQSQVELKHKDFDASLKTLLRFSPDPSDREMAAGVAYHTQEALALAYTKGGNKLALKHMRELLEKLPNFGSLQDQFRNFTQELAESFAEKGRYEQAFTTIEELKSAFKDDNTAIQLRGVVFIIWAEKLEKEMGFEAAYNKLLEAMNACPGCKSVSEHAENCVARWGGDFIDQKKWSEAIKTYELGLKTFPDNSVMKNNIDFCKQEMKKN